MLLNGFFFDIFNFKSRKLLSLNKSLMFLFYPFSSLLISEFVNCQTNLNYPDLLT